MEVTSFFHRIAEHAAKSFLETPKVTILIVGGPGQTKNDFVKGDFLHYELKKALLNVEDTQSAREDGVREMFGKSTDSLLNVCGPEEKKTMELVQTELSKENGLAIAGLDAVLEALKNGAVEVALVADNLDYAEIVATCKKCGTPKTEIIRKKNAQSLRDILSQPCVRCGALGYELVEKDIVDVLEDAAAQTNARVEVIFTGVEEKAQLAALGGFAALLRYRTQS